MRLRKKRRLLPLFLFIVFITTIHTFHVGEVYNDLDDCVTSDDSFNNYVKTKIVRKITKTNVLDRGKESVDPKQNSKSIKRFKIYAQKDLISKKHDIETTSSNHRTRKRDKIPLIRWQDQSNKDNDKTPRKRTNLQQKEISFYANLFADRKMIKPVNVKDQIAEETQKKLGDEGPEEAGYGSKSQPAKSCRDIFLTNRNIPSGNYWIKTADGELLMVTCGFPTHEQEAGELLGNQEANNEEDEKKNGTDPDRLQGGMWPYKNEPSMTPEIKQFLEAHNISIPAATNGANLVSSPAQAKDKTKGGGKKDEKLNKETSKEKNSEDKGMEGKSSSGSLKNPAPITLPMGPSNSMQKDNPNKVTSIPTKRPHYSKPAGQSKIGITQPYATLVPKPPAPTEPPPTKKKRTSPKPSKRPTTKRNPTTKHRATMKVTKKPKRTSRPTHRTSLAPTLHKVTPTTVPKRTKHKADTLEEFEGNMQKPSKKPTRAKNSPKRSSKKPTLRPTTTKAPKRPPPSTKEETKVGVVETSQREETAQIAPNTAPIQQAAIQAPIQSITQDQVKISKPTLIEPIRNLPHSSATNPPIETEITQPNQLQQIQKSPHSLVGTPPIELPNPPAPNIGGSQFTLVNGVSSDPYENAQRIEQVQKDIDTNAHHEEFVLPANPNMISLPPTEQKTVAPGSNNTTVVESIPSAESPYTVNASKANQDTSKAFAKLYGIGNAGDLGDIQEEYPPAKVGSGNTAADELYGRRLKSIQQEMKYKNPDQAITKDYKAAMEFETQPQVRSWTYRENKIIQRHAFDQQYKAFELDKSSGPKPKNNGEEKAQVRSWANNRAEMANKQIQEQYDNFEKTNKQILKERADSEFAKQYADFEEVKNETLQQEDSGNNTANSTHGNKHSENERKASDKSQRERDEKVKDDIDSKNNESTKNNNKPENKPDEKQKKENSDSSGNQNKTKSDDDYQTYIDKIDDVSKKQNPHNNTGTFNAPVNTTVDNSTITNSTSQNYYEPIQTDSSTPVNNYTAGLVKIGDGSPSMYTNAPLGTSVSNSTHLENINGQETPVKETNATVVLTARKRAEYLIPSKRHKQTDVEEILNNPKPLNVVSGLRKDIVFDNENEDIMDMFFLNNTNPSYDEDEFENLKALNEFHHKLKQISGPPNPSLQEYSMEKSAHGLSIHNVAPPSSVKIAANKKHDIKLKESTERIRKKEEEKYDLYKKLHGGESKDEDKSSNIYVDNRVFIVGNVKGGNSNIPTVSQAVIKKEKEGEEKVERKITLERSDSRDTDLAYSNKISKTGSSKSKIIEAHGEKTVPSDLAEFRSMWNQPLKEVGSYDKRFDFNDLLKGSNVSIENHVHSTGTLKALVSSPPEGQVNGQTTEMKVRKLKTVPNPYNFIIPETRKFVATEGGSQTLQDNNNLEGKDMTTATKKKEIEQQKRIKFIRAQALSKDDVSVGKFSSSDLKMFSYKKSPHELEHPHGLIGEDVTNAYGFANEIDGFVQGIKAKNNQDYISDDREHHKTTEHHDLTSLPVSIDNKNSKKLFSQIRFIGNTTDSRTIASALSQRALRTGMRPVLHAQQQAQSRHKIPIENLVSEDEENNSDIVDEQRSSRWNLQGVNKPLHTIGHNMQDLITSAQATMGNVPGLTEKNRQEEQRAKNNQQNTPQVPKQGFLKENRAKLSKHEDKKIKAEKLPGAEKRSEITTERPNYKRHNKKYTMEVQEHPVKREVRKTRAQRNKSYPTKIAIVDEMEKRNTIGHPKLPTSKTHNLNRNGNTFPEDAATEQYKQLSDEDINANPATIEIRNVKSYGLENDSLVVIYNVRPTYAQHEGRRTLTKLSHSSAQSNNEDQTFIATKVYTGREKNNEGSHIERITLGNVQEYKIWENSTLSAIQNARKLLVSDNHKNQPGNRPTLNHKRSPKNKNNKKYHERFAEALHNLRRRVKATPSMRYQPHKKHQEQSSSIRKQALIQKPSVFNTTKNTPNLDPTPLNVSSVSRYQIDKNQVLNVVQNVQKISEYSSSNKILKLPKSKIALKDHKVTKMHNGYDNTENNTANVSKQDENERQNKINISNIDRYHVDKDQTLNVIHDVQKIHQHQNIYDANTTTISAMKKNEVKILNVVHNVQRISEYKNNNNKILQLKGKSDLRKHNVTTMRNYYDNAKNNTSNVSKQDENKIQNTADISNTGRYHIDKDQTLNVIYNVREIHQHPRSTVSALGKNEVTVQNIDAFNTTNDTLYATYNVQNTPLTLPLLNVSNVDRHDIDDNQTLSIVHNVQDAIQKTEQNDGVLNITKPMRKHKIKQTIKELKAPTASYKSAPPALSMSTTVHVDKITDIPRYKKRKKEPSKMKKLTAPAMKLHKEFTQTFYLKKALFNGIFPEPKIIKIHAKHTIQRGQKSNAKIQLMGSRGRGFRNALLIKMLQKMKKHHHKKSDIEIYEGLYNKMKTLKRKRKSSDDGEVSASAAADVKNIHAEPLSISAVANYRVTESKNDTAVLNVVRNVQRITTKNQSRKRSYVHHYIMKNMSRVIRDLIPSKVGQLQPSNLKPMPPVGHDPDEAPLSENVVTAETSNQQLRLNKQDNEQQKANELSTKQDNQQQKPNELSNNQLQKPNEPDSKQEESNQQERSQNKPNKLDNQQTTPTENGVQTSNPDEQQHRQQEQEAPSDQNIKQQEDNNPSNEGSTEVPPIGADRKPHADSGPQDEKVAEASAVQPTEPPANKTAPDVGESGKNEVGTSAKGVTTSKAPDSAGNTIEHKLKNGKTTADTTFEAGLQDNENTAAKGKNQDPENMNDHSSTNNHPTQDSNGNIDLGTQQSNKETGSISHAQTNSQNNQHSTDGLENITTFNHHINVTALEIGIMKLLNQTAPQQNTQPTETDKEKQNLEKLVQAQNKKYPELKLPSKDGEYIPPRSDNEENNTANENKSEAQRISAGAINGRINPDSHKSLKPPLPPTKSSNSKNNNHTDDEFGYIVDSTPVESADTDALQKPTESIDTADENTEDTSKNTVTEGQQLSSEHNVNPPVANDQSNQTSATEKSNNNKVKNSEQQDSATNNASQEKGGNTQLTIPSVAGDGGTQTIPLIPIPLDSPLGKVLYPALENSSTSSQTDKSEKNIHSETVSATVNGTGFSEIITDQTKQLLSRGKLSREELLSLLDTSRQQVTRFHISNPSEKNKTSVLDNKKDDVRSKLNKLSLSETRAKLNLPRNTNVMLTSASNYGDSIHISVQNQNGHLVLMPDQLQAYHKKMIPQNISLKLYNSRKKNFIYKHNHDVKRTVRHILQSKLNTYYVKRDYKTGTDNTSGITVIT